MIKLSRIGYLSEREQRLNGYFFLIWVPIVIVFALFTGGLVNAPKALLVQRYVFLGIYLTLGILPFLNSPFFKKWYGWCIAVVFTVRVLVGIHYVASIGFDFNVSASFMIIFLISVLVIRSRVLLLLFGIITGTYFTILIFQSSLTQADIQVKLFTFLFTFLLLASRTVIDQMFKGYQKEALSIAETKLNLRVQHLKDQVALSDQRKIEISQIKDICSHDVRQPVHSIYTLSTIILENETKNLSQEGEEYVKLLRSKAEDLSAIVTGVISILDMASNKTLDELVDVKTMLPTILMGLPNQEHATFKIIGTMPKLFINQLQMYGVLVALLENAIFHNKSVKNLVIEIGYHFEKNKHVFFIRDNGIGIDSRYFDKIFQPFEYLEKQENLSGQGLGLALVKKIIEKNKGEIWVTSTLNVGTTFYIQLPNKKEGTTA